MSCSARGSIPQEGVQGSNEWKNTRAKRAVRISSIVAQEVSSQGRCNLFLHYLIYTAVQKFVVSKICFPFSKNTLNLSNVIVNILIMLQKISISNKCCSFKYSIHLKYPENKILSSTTVLIRKVPEHQINILELFLMITWHWRLE